LVELVAPVLVEPLFVALLVALLLPGPSNGEPALPFSIEFDGWVCGVLLEAEEVSGVDPPWFVCAPFVCEPFVDDAFGDPLDAPFALLATHGFPGAFGAFGFACCGFPGVPVGDVPFVFVVCGAVVEFWPEAWVVIVVGGPSVELPVWVVPELVSPVVEPVGGGVVGVAVCAVGAVEVWGAGRAAVLCATAKLVKVNKTEKARILVFVISTLRIRSNEAAWLHSVSTSCEAAAIRSSL
jgi:hypothetical protein